MDTFRVEKNKNYSVINNQFLSDKSLSWKAKGVLTWLLSRPDDWKIYLKDLQERSTDKKTSTNAAIVELIDAGYVKRDEVRYKGRFKGYDYSVAEVPIFKASHRSQENRSGLTAAENPETENQPLLSTDLNQVLIKTNTKNKQKENLSLDCEELIRYYNELTNRKFKGDEALKSNIKRVLDKHDIEICKQVIRYIVNNKWYKDSYNDRLSVIFRPTKFIEKLEQAELFNDLQFDIETACKWNCPTCKNGLIERTHKTINEKHLCQGYNQKWWYCKKCNKSLYDKKEWVAPKKDNRVSSFVHNLLNGGA